MKRSVILIVGLCLGIRLTLKPGAYTAVMSDDAGGGGIGLVEVYDLNPASDSKLANISTRICRHPG